MDQITPLVLTWNEAENIERCLEKLNWAGRVIVVDSFSQDDTVARIKKFSNVELFQRKFNNHREQWNYGLSLVKTKWVLALDADYILSNALLEELYAWVPEAEGYFIPFKYCLNGIPLRHTLLPPRLALFQTKKAKYVQDGHTQLLVLDGSVKKMNQFILHDDRKPFLRWWAAQKKYAELEAEKLKIMPFSGLSLQDKLRRMILVAPLLVFVYCYFYRGLILDGWNGLIYSGQRFLAEQLLSFALIRRWFGAA